jgi:hypothetical protein
MKGSDSSKSLRSTIGQTSTVVLAEADQSAIESQSRVPPWTAPLAQFGQASRLQFLDAAGEAPAAYK